jgi:hypothetical protein
MNPQCLRRFYPFQGIASVCAPAAGWTQGVFAQTYIPWLVFGALGAVDRPPTASRSD